MRFALGVFGWAFALWACGDSSSGPCTLTAIGAQCQADTDCCSGYCMLYETAAYCQQKPKTPQACVDSGGFCTQNRNCCNGLCQNGACYGSPNPLCLELGSSCVEDSSCCSNNCISDGLGNTACASQPVPDGGPPSCGLPGAACSAPGMPDPSECCFGVCGSTSQCVGGGGGGGPNCGGSGTFCRYGSDCCSGVCEQVTSGGACH